MTACCVMGTACKGGTLVSRISRMRLGGARSRVKEEYVPKGRGG